MAIKREYLDENRPYVHSHYVYFVDNLDHFMGSGFNTGKPPVLTGEFKSKMAQLKAVRDQLYDRTNSFLGGTAAAPARIQDLFQQITGDNRLMYADVMREVLNMPEGIRILGSIPKEALSEIFSSRLQGTTKYKKFVDDIKEDAVDVHELIGIINEYIMKDGLKTKTSTKQGINSRFRQTFNVSNKNIDDALKNYSKTVFKTGFTSKKSRILKNDIKDLLSEVIEKSGLENANL